MDWTKVMEFIQPELFLIVVFLWCLGLFLKRAPWFKAEWQIPFILLGVSILITILYISIVLNEGWSASVIVSCIIQGVIVAALSVFGNEALKQLRVKRPLDKKGV
jgi:hypothetical protein